MCGINCPAPVLPDTDHTSHCLVQEEYDSGAEDSNACGTGSSDGETSSLNHPPDHMAYPASSAEHMDTSEATSTHHPDVLASSTDSNTQPHHIDNVPLLDFVHPSAVTHTTTTTSTAPTQHQPTPHTTTTTTSEAPDIPQLGPAATDARAYTQPHTDAVLSSFVDSHGLLMQVMGDGLSTNEMPENSLYPPTNNEEHAALGDLESEIRSIIDQ